MGKKPKVSVVIPTHNRAQFLKAAIASVLNQTYQDFEIVVVDDASSDDTQKVVSLCRDERIKYIRHEVNKGDAGSRNTGIVHSHGDYVAFLDDDDEWLPEKLKMQVDLLESSPAQVGGIYTGSLSLDTRSGKILNVNIPPRKRHLFEDIFVNNFIATSCILLRRECIERVGLFDERIPFCSDYDMWIRIAEQFHFDCVAEPLVIYHVHDYKLSTNLTSVLKGHEIIIEKYNSRFAVNRRNLGRLYSTVGILYFLNGNIEKSRQALFQAVKSRPLAIKLYLILALSFLHSSILKTLMQINEQTAALLRRKSLHQELDRLASTSALSTVRSICRAGLPN
jgi:glycosyltransferase involved in cell wall biosynthesis